jgi:hypothetical protein
VALCRSIVVFGLIAVWLATPAIACLPDSHMTHAEMACCKKMAGDCHMGEKHHPCCKPERTLTTPAATVQQVVQVHPGVMMMALVIRHFHFELITEARFAEANLGLPPPGPPQASTTLRI